MGADRAIRRGRPAATAASSSSASRRFVATGLVAWRELPVEAFPDLTNNQVVVVTEAPGLAATEVEQRVTYPIETALMGVPGAEQVRSALEVRALDRHASSSRTRVPVYFARQLVTERMLEARSRIPDGLEPDARAGGDRLRRDLPVPRSRATRPTR
ncbi:MAG: efflux RND transporter permease subunit [Ignavibacteriales bacterium]|nr:efflux RND transporter permease subunit [Ignavibacteriales bacterium]